jgi:hypothetical protein
MSEKRRQLSPLHKKRSETARADLPCWFSTSLRVGVQTCRNDPCVGLRRTNGMNFGASSEPSRPRPGIPVADGGPTTDRGIDGLSSAFV